MIDCLKTIIFIHLPTRDMSDLEQDDIVDSTDVDDTNQDMPESFEYDEVVKMKGSLDKATSNYVLPWKDLLKKYGVKTFAELESKLSQEKDNFITKDAHELERFLDKAPDLSEKRDELLEVAKALQALPKNKEKSLREMLDLASKTLKVEEEHQVNQEKLKKSRVSDWDSFSDSWTISKADLIKIASSNPSKYAEISNKMEKWLIKVVE